MRPLSSLSPVIRPGQPGLVFFSLVLSLLTLSGCGGKIYLVTSLRPSHPVVIDGNADDWTGTLSYVPKDQLFVGFVNDREDLSICLTSEEGGGPAADRRSGWTVWFDPAGGTRKTYGLRIAPHGGPPDGLDPGPERKPSEDPAEPEQGDQGAPAEPGLELQWIGTNGEALRTLTPDEAAKLGLEVREGHAGGAYVLEIKIPLETSAGHPLAVGAGPDSAVGVGFFSNRAERRGGPGGVGGGAGRPGPGGGGMPGGRGGGAVGGPGGGWRGAMEPNLNPDLAKTVKVWTRVRLNASDRPEPSTLLALISD
jgi:hypothetical protein